MNGLAETLKIARFPRFRRAAPFSKLLDLAGGFIDYYAISFFFSAVN